MTNDDLYSSGIFASELEDDFGGGVDPEKELNPDDFLDDDDLGDDDLDLDDDDDAEASYNPLEDYKSDEWS